jgi:hypothetical protein
MPRHVHPWPILSSRPPEPTSSNPEPLFFDRRSSAFIGGYFSLGCRYESNSPISGPHYLIALPPVIAIDR